MFVSLLSKSLALPGEGKQFACHPAAPDAEDTAPCLRAGEPEATVASEFFSVFL
jgi:hypothetical protein